MSVAARGASGESRLLGLLSNPEALQARMDQLKQASDELDAKKAEAEAVIRKRVELEELDAHLAALRKQVEAVEKRASSAKADTDRYVEQRLAEAEKHYGERARTVLRADEALKAREKRLADLEKALAGRQTLLRKAEEEAAALSAEAKRERALFADKHDRLMAVINSLAKET